MAAILFDSTRARKIDSTFAAGLYPARPGRPTDAIGNRLPSGPTADDAAWWAQEANDPDSPDGDLDRSRDLFAPAPAAEPADEWDILDPADDPALPADWRPEGVDINAPGVAEDYPGADDADEPADEWGLDDVVGLAYPSLWGDWSDLYRVGIGPGPLDDQDLYPIPGMTS